MEIFDASLLAATVTIAAPLVLGATGELVSERAGVFNVGMEGMILMGAFFGFLAENKTGDVIAGVAAGAAGGVTVGVLMAFIAVELKANQIVTGVGLILFATGLTAYLFETLFAITPEAMNPMSPVAIPGLADLGGAGRALFDQEPLVYVAFIMVPIVSVLLYRTRWGVSIRAVGEAPRAADTAGVSIRKVQWACTLFAGGMGGLAGALLSVGDVGTFTEGMSGGRGFLVLAAVLFGRWQPRWVVASCLLFAGSDALQLRLQGLPAVPREVWVAMAAVSFAFAAYAIWKKSGATRLAVGIALGMVGTILSVANPQVQIASQLWLSLPYLLALAVLAGSVGHTRIPTHLGIAYRRSEAT
jgi:simple sugar transport system permease protein